MARQELNDLIADGSASGEALHLKAMLEVQAGSLNGAATYLRLALETHAGEPAWTRDLATVLAVQGEWHSASVLYEQVLDKSPDDDIALAGYGRTLLELGLNESAIETLEKALRVRESWAAFLALARALLATERPNEAAEVIERAIGVGPQRIQAYLALAEIYRTCGQPDIALKNCNTALELAPDDPEARAGLIRTLWDLGELNLTLREIEKLVDEGLASENLHAFWLYIRMYGTEESLESTRQRCAEFGRLIKPPSVRSRDDFAHRNSQKARSKLKIGYLTGELVSGPAFYFLSPLVGNHDRREFDVFLYHTREKYDDATRWYSELGNFVDCRRLDDEALKMRIESDGIDVLVDASGFFPDNRLRIFAGRAAQVQMTYPNCPTTTGVAEIDYILTDRWTCPEGHEIQYVEKPVFLPSGYLTFAPSRNAPETGPTPVARNGFVTFGVFQRRAKMNARFWDAVAAVLLETPGSRLLLQHYDLTLDEPDSENRRFFVEELARRGVSEDRINLRGARPHREALACMGETDIALDTFPYQGQTTTCECLWQGVPVVALSGTTHVARVGSALLERCRLGELVAESAEEYVRIASRLARDPRAISLMRDGMRDRLRGSTLLDGPKLARDVEQMFRRVANRAV